jgi:hypothetical protein
MVTLGSIHIVATDQIDRVVKKSLLTIAATCSSSRRLISICKNANIILVVKRVRLCGYSRE